QIGLRNLSLFEKNDAQWAQRRRVIRGKFKDFAISALRFAIFPRGKSIIGVRQKLLFGGLFFGTAGNGHGQQAKREDQLPAAGSHARDHRNHGSVAHPNTVRSPQEFVSSYWAFSALRPLIQCLWRRLGSSRSAMH